MYLQRIRNMRQEVVKGKSKSCGYRVGMYVGGQAPHKDPDKGGRRPEKGLIKADKSGQRTDKNGQRQTRLDKERTKSRK